MLVESFLNVKRSVGTDLEAEKTRAKMEKMPLELGNMCVANIELVDLLDPKTPRFSGSARNYLLVTTFKKVKPWCLKSETLGRAVIILPTLTAQLYGDCRKPLVADLVLNQPTFHGL